MTGFKCCDGTVFINDEATFQSHIRLHFRKVNPRDGGFVCPLQNCLTPISNQKWVRQHFTKFHQQLVPFLFKGRTPPRSTQKKNEMYIYGEYDCENATDPPNQIIQQHDPAIASFSCNYEWDNEMDTSEVPDPNHPSSKPSEFSDLNHHPSSEPPEFPDPNHHPSSEPPEFPDPYHPLSSADDSAEPSESVRLIENSLNHSNHQSEIAVSDVPVYLDLWDKFIKSLESTEVEHLLCKAKSSTRIPEKAIVICFKLVADYFQRQYNEGKLNQKTFDTFQKYTNSFYYVNKHKLTPGDESMIKTTLIESTIANECFPTYYVSLIFLFKHLASDVDFMRAVLKEHFSK